jgi:hypothetical protein
MVSRRDVLKLGVAGAAALAAGAGAGKILQAAEAGKPKVAVQLYSVRDLCAKDLAGTVAAIGKMGYKGVEFAGYYGKSAADLRKMLDDNGLVCCGTHTGLEPSRATTWPRPWTSTRPSATPSSSSRA